MSMAGSAGTRGEAPRETSRSALRFEYAYIYIYSYFSLSYFIFPHIYPEVHWFVKGFSID